MYTAFLKNIKGDKVIWGVIIVLFLFSLLTIYSTTSVLAKPRTSYLISQFGFVFAAFIAVYIMHIIPVGLYRNFAKPSLVLGALLVVVMLLFGVTENDATRWLRIPGIGIKFQPIDLARIAVILYTAKIMESEDLNSFRDFFKKLLIPLGIIFLLFLMAGISTALLMALTVFALWFVGGIKTGHLVKSFGIFVAALSLIVVIDRATPLNLIRSETGESRLTNFFSGIESKQTRISKIAIAQGGVFGAGPGNSELRSHIDLPFSDFVYPVIIEEYGVAGGVSVMLLYLILLFRVIVIARSCKRVFTMIMVLGLVFMITFQAMVNMSVAVGIFPLTGQTLPMISKGGTSIVTFGMALGMILAVSRATEERDMKQQINKQ